MPFLLDSRSEMKICNQKSFYRENHHHLVNSTLFKKMRFSNKDFFSKFDQIQSFLRISSHLLKKSTLLENFIFFFAVVRRRRSRVFVNPFYKFTELLHNQSLHNEKIGNLLFPVSLFKLSNNILWHS